jgi:hypothetical protein
MDQLRGNNLQLRLSVIRYITRFLIPVVVILGLAVNIIITQLRFKNNATYQSKPSWDTH